MGTVTTSWVFIGLGAALLAFAYGRYFLAGRRPRAERERADPNAPDIDRGGMNNRQYDVAAIADALHRCPARDPRDGASRLPRDLEPLFDELEPALAVSGDQELVAQAIDDDPTEIAQELFDETVPTPRVDGGQRELTCLNVIAKPGRVLSGAALKGQFLGRGFEHGEMRIFHSRFNQQTLFSVVNMVEPGYFDVDTMEAMTTPGVSFFLQLPGPLRDDVAFDMMLSEAHELAQALDAELRDEHQAPLSREALEEVRARLIRSANARFGVADADH